MTLFPTPDNQKNSRPSLLPSFSRWFPWILLLGIILFAQTRRAWSLGGVTRTLLDHPLVPWVSVPLAMGSLLGLLVVVWLGLHNRPRENLPRWVAPDRLFLLLLCATLFFWRWPFFAFFELNVDESQDLAAARTLLADPRYWFSTDTMTHGPLISVILTPVALLGMKPEYGAARLVGLALMTGSVLLLWRILLRFFPSPVARLLVMPAVLSISFLTHLDLLAYNGEHLITFLTLVTGYFAVRTRFAHAPSVTWLLLTVGFCLGLMPYVKFQGIPLALLVALVAIVPGWEPLSPSTGRETVRRFLLLFSGSMLPTVVAILYAVVIGVPGHFFQSFVLWTLKYASSGKDALLADLNRTLWHTLFWVVPEGKNELMTPWVALSILIGCILLLAVAKKENRRLLILPGCGLLLFLGAYFIVVKPERDFHHYLLLFLLPACFWNATLWGQILAFATTGNRIRLRTVALLTFALLNVVAPTILEIHARLLVVRYVTQPVLRYTYNSQAPVIFQDMYTWQRRGAIYVGDVIRKNTDPEDSIVIWGWVPELYVLGERKQGTRDAILARVVTPSGYRDPYFLKVFVEDIERNKPVLFLDIVGPGSFLYSKREGFAPQDFPEVKALLDRDYVLINRVGSVYFYARKDRIETLPNSGKPPAKKGIP